MPLENASTIEALDQTWPLGADQASRGDDHIRMIKAVLKAQFPGAGGTGLSSPVEATEDEFSYLVGVTSPIQTQINAINSTLSTQGVNLSAPVGTRMPFAQAAAPTGWLTDATNHDYMMRVVNANGGAIGGTDSPINLSAAHTHNTADHTLTIQQMPSHSHVVPVGIAGMYASGSGLWRDGGPARSTQATGGNEPHNHGPTTSTTVTFTPRYMNMIIAVKQ